MKNSKILGDCKNFGNNLQKKYELKTLIKKLTGKN